MDIYTDNLIYINDSSVNYCVKPFDNFFCSNACDVSRHKSSRRKIIEQVSIFHQVLNSY